MPSTEDTEDESRESPQPAHGIENGPENDISKDSIMPQPAGRWKKLFYHLCKLFTRLFRLRRLASNSDRLFNQAYNCSEETLVEKGGTGGSLELAEKTPRHSGTFTRLLGKSKTHVLLGSNEKIPAKPPNREKRWKCQMLIKRGEWALFST
ncbi:hypothetical protein BX600DRAFT_469883 [Xylariales sp. PMI_506]|nr:hypothetical protein BX600DRAFT_469883 [Xylariales sp. PMI_506]